MPVSRGAFRGASIYGAGVTLWVRVGRAAHKLACPVLPQYLLRQPVIGVAGCACWVPLGWISKPAPKSLSERAEYL